MLFKYVFEIDNIAYKYEREVFTFERALPIVGGFLTMILFIAGVCMNPFMKDLLIFRVLQRNKNAMKFDLHTGKFFVKK